MLVQDACIVRVTTYRYKGSFEKSHNVALHNTKSSQFKFLRGVVFIDALKKIVDESKLVALSG